MNRIKVLHIVPWFPNPDNKIEAIFIAKHIQALNHHCENSILHLRFGQNLVMEKDLNFSGIKLDRITLKPLFNRWRIKEITATNYIRRYLKKNEKIYDIVNFYIAYPNAISIGKLKHEFPRLKFCISEQWSAYHENFNLSENNKGRLRIAEIFKHKIPLNVVSNALGQDIRDFSNQPELEYSVIPNIVDDKTFNFQEKKKSKYFVFCSINAWSQMKNPFVLIDAFHLINKEFPNTRLILAGSGNLDTQIKEHVHELDLTSVITLKGRITKNEVADLLQYTNVYCQSSIYETFSAICIEALACGTPVIATNIGGMKDFIHAKNGILVDKMNATAWSKAMKKSMVNYEEYELANISKQCIEQYNENKIGQIYHSTLVRIANA